LNGSALTVKEKGLPTGEAWYLDLGGWPVGASTSSFQVANLTAGSYAYTFDEFPGVPATAKLGGASLPLNGTLDLTRSATATVTYAYPFAVTFVETGLPLSLNWSITIQGKTLTAPAGTNITFNLSDGNYGYKIGKIAGYVSVALPHVAKVDGLPVTIEVLFGPKG